MLYEEAQWVGNKLQTVFSSGQRILNLGSSTLHARAVLQPHMSTFIFEPLQKRGVEVIHSDISNEEGVDLVGDFTDPEFIATLKSQQFDGVLCCNLLEHLEDRQLLVDSLKEIVPENGILLLTVPKQYPYHLDPIDTMYRPSPGALADLFPGFEIINSEIVKAKRQIQKDGKFYFHKNYFEQLKSDPKLFILLIFRILLPFYKFRNWIITVNDLKRMYTPFSVSCVLLKKV